MPKYSCVLPTLLSVVITVASAQSSGDASARAVIAHARKNYYSLQQNRIRELKCYASPDWAEVLTSIPSSTADFRKRALPYLSKTVFKVDMTESGTNVTVEPTDNNAPPELGSDLAHIIELVRTDVQQNLDLWRMMTFKPLLPASRAAYRLAHRDGKYELVDGDQQLELDEAGMIQELNGSIPNEHVTISMPLRYAESPKGVVLSNLGLRVANGPAQQLEMTVQYFEQDGLQLPFTIGCKSQHPSGTVITTTKIDRYDILRN